jgi:sugar phosphate isomerase/epimerase
VEQKVKENDIKLAIHIHGPDNQNFHDADEVIQYVGNRDARLGICLDVGHTVRYGKDPVKHILQYKDRIFDIHIKDVTAPSKEGKTCPMGRGVIDLPAVVKALKEINYQGVCSLEYEPTPENPYPATSESIGYLRGLCDVIY